MPPPTPGQPLDRVRPPRPGGALSGPRRHGKWVDLPRPIAFVLSGGSSLGGLQVGMLAALEEAGLVPDLLVGTSVGALNAAYAASGLGAGRLERLAEIWRALTTGDVFQGLGLWSAAKALVGAGTLASPAGLEALVEAHLPATHEALAIPCAVVATDLAGGGAVVLGEGDLRSNVLASAAIPGIFPPVVRGAQVLADGGVVAHVPILPARDLGARTLVVLDAGFP